MDPATCFDSQDAARSDPQTRLDVVPTGGGGARRRRDASAGDQGLSAPAKVMLDSFPLLNFMRSSVLVYPTRTVSRKS